MTDYFYWLKSVTDDAWKKVGRDLWLDILSKTGSLRQRRDDNEYLKTFEAIPFGDGLISGALTREDKAPAF